MARIQRLLVSVIMRSGAGVLLLQRGQPYSEFLRHDPHSQVGIALWELPGGTAQAQQPERMRLVGVPMA
jgi:hypothetical protein